MHLPSPVGVKGSVAYDVSVTYILPWGQELIGNATIKGQPVNIKVTGKVIEFPAEPIIDATHDEVIINYRFDVRSEVAVQIDHKPDIQTDTAQVDWSVNPTGTPRFTVDDELNITILISSGKKDC